MVSFINAFAQAGVVPVAPVTPQVKGEVQTPNVRTLEYNTTMFQTVDIMSAGGEKPLVVYKPVVKPSMSVEEQKRFERFQKLHSPHFDGDACEDAQYFLD